MQRGRVISKRSHGSQGCQLYPQQQWPSWASSSLQEDSYDSHQMITYDHNTPYKLSCESNIFVRSYSLYRIYPILFSLRFHWTRIKEKVRHWMKPRDAKAPTVAKILRKGSWCRCRWSGAKPKERWEECGMEPDWTGPNVLKTIQAQWDRFTHHMPQTAVSAIQILCPLDSTPSYFLDQYRSICCEDPCWWIWNMGWMPESARIFLSHQVVAELVFKKQDLRIELVCLPSRMHGSWSVMPSKKTWMVVFSTIEYAIATWCHCCQLIQAH